MCSTYGWFSTVSIALVVMPLSFAVRCSYNTGFNIHPKQFFYGIQSVITPAIAFSIRFSLYRYHDFFHIVRSRDIAREGNQYFGIFFLDKQYFGINTYCWIIVVVRLDTHKCDIRKLNNAFSIPAGKGQT